MFNNQIIAGSSGQGGGSFYPVTIDDSLRFEDGSSAHLTRTPAVAGSLTTWTWSGWVKRGNLLGGMPARGTIFSGSGVTAFGFFNPTSNGAADNFGAYMSTGEDDRFMTNRIFRDTSSWYHLVVVWDSTNGTAGDRFRLYVNGVRETSWSRFDTVTQNRTAGINAAVGHGIGVQANAGSQYFDGYLSDIYLIDGQALDPTDFGETEDGVWIPKSYSGSYGTNGFHLELKGNTNDASGNSNNWTANNISAHDYVPDSPTNNFCTLNPLAKGSGTITFSEGNLKSSTSASVAAAEHGATFTIPKSGKWYWEAAYTGANTGGSQAALMGIMDIDTQTVGLSGNHLTTTTGDYITYYTHNSGIYENNVLDSSFSGNEAAATVGFALDMDNGYLFVHLNGTYIGGTPNFSTGANHAAEPNTTRTWLPFFGANGGSTITWTANFGQDSTFAGATTAGGNTDANGKGDFQHPVPSGFLAVCSANLPDSTIGPGQTALAEDYFVPYIYTADGTSPKSRTGLGFSPDFLWFKDRTVALSHALYDTIRGPNKGLQTNSTSAENSYNALNSFDADGFTTITDGTVGNLLNNSTDSYVAWSWKAGGTPTATNSAGAGAVPTSGSVLIDGVASTSALAGTIAANKITANTEAGFSLINYTGNGLSGQTVAHSLSSPPEFLIHKDRGTNSNNGQWNAWHKYAGDGDDYGYLSATNAFTGSAQIIPNGTDTIELKANLTTTNQSGHSFIMYAFHSVEGYSKAGSFTGNSNVDGAFVYTGFRPSFVLFRSAAISANWYIIDNKRNPSNVVTKYLRPILSNTEGSLDFVDFLSNGFKLRSSSTEINGTNVIYLAFAETPFKYANAR